MSLNAHSSRGSLVFIASLSQTQLGFSLRVGIQSTVKMTDSEDWGALVAQQEQGLEQVHRGV